MDISSEKQLVNQARKDPQKFAELYDLYYTPIFKYTVKRTGHLESAQDITAEVFFKAYKKLWQFKWQGRPFSAWLYKIATNEINSYFKNGQKAPVPVAYIEELSHLSIDLKTPEIEMLFKESLGLNVTKAAELVKTLHKLPVKYQEVLALRYFEEKSILEICEILGKKQGTVKSLISRGIDSLQKLMQPSEEYPVIQSESIINKPKL